MHAIFTCGCQLVYKYAMNGSVCIRVEALGTVGDNGEVGSVCACVLYGDGTVRDNGDIRSVFMCVMG